ncbi:hypothetical protein LUZ60_003471 [Juncus effusus]|nr:hypothetical protein LUZ60_003471 [Juncus effusus]
MIDLTPICNSHMHMFMIVFTAVVVAFVSDTLGTVVTDGAVIMGLALPKGPPLGTALMERVDLVSTELFLPIILVKELGYLMSWEGVKKNLILWFWVEVVLVLSFIFRTVATMAAAVYCNMSVKNGFLLGLIMNFRGLVEVLTCMRFVGLGLLDSATFAMVVVSTVTITSVCAPLVSIYYKPLSGKKQMGHLTVQRLWSNAELRVMTCFYNDKPVPALLHLLESCVPEQSSTCIYALHLNKKSVVVLPFTSIAPAKTMHQDACTLILERNIAFVVVPFPKINSMADVETSFTMRSLVPLLLEQAPCSVGILVYHGMTTITMPTKDWKYRVCVLFWGGPDDREVISVACRLARHHQVYLEVLRFCASSETESHEQNVNDFGEIAHDDAVIRKLQAENIENTRVVVNEIHVRNLEEVLLMIRNIGDQNYDLIIVGRRQNNSAMPGEDGLSGWTQFPELGVMGDMLATDVSGTSNLLIVQQNSSS